MPTIVDGFLFVLHPLHFPFLVLGVALGIIVGALPGLTASVGIILLLPFLFYLDPSTGMVMLCGAFCGGIYGGSISAILISTPGTPSAAATVLDGYPMTKKGEAGKALGMATLASTMGGIISTFCLMFFAPILAQFALEFGPAEYFALTIFGLTIIASVAGKSLTKGIVSGFFGLLIATVGIDPVEGYERFSFGIPNLMTGFSLLPVLIGLFAISQVFIQLEDIGKEIKKFDQKIGKVLPSWKELKGLLVLIVLCSLLGTLIGIIPGTGGTIAAFLAYNEAKRWSKDPDSFGKGNIAGVAAPESANNGTTGGALVPMMTLGIPGDVVTAVMLGCLILVGLKPGPLLFKENPDLVQAVFAGMLLANVLILVLGVVSVKVFPKVLRVPIPVLFPIVFTLCFLGAFSLKNATWDMFIALIFGIIGYIMEKKGFSSVPMVLGVILGPIAEESLGQAMIISHGDLTTLFRSPISIFFWVISALSIAFSLRNHFAGLKAAKKKTGGS
jgi:putative tricarboxylic transport membrane protein